MPYKIIKKGTKFTVKNMATGKITAKKTSKPNAEAQVRLLQAIEHGYKPKK
jgi:hypothetical protein